MIYICSINVFWPELIFRLSYNFIDEFLKVFSIALQFISVSDNYFKYIWNIHKYNGNVLTWRNN